MRGMWGEGLDIHSELCLTEFFERQVTGEDVSADSLVVFCEGILMQHQNGRISLGRCATNLVKLDTYLTTE